MRCPFRDSIIAEKSGSICRISLYVVLPTVIWYSSCKENKCGQDIPNIHSHRRAAKILLPTETLISASLFNHLSIARILDSKISCSLRIIKALNRYSVPDCSFSISGTDLIIDRLLPLRLLYGVITSPVAACICFIVAAFAFSLPATPFQRQLPEPSQVLSTPSGVVAVLGRWRFFSDSEVR